MGTWSSFACRELFDGLNFWRIVPGGAALPPGRPGLSGISLCVLGKPLNKAMQVSAWGFRPLSAAQLHYAALDAYAALMIFQRVLQLEPVAALRLVNLLLRKD